MDKIEEFRARGRLLPGQFTAGDALSTALEKLIAEGIQSMEQRDREYEAWKKARSAMPRKLAVVEEFTVQGDEVKHVPTKATFSAYPGGVDIATCLMGHLGSVLPNGDDYNEESVWAIARQLMKDRPIEVS